eukprot:COSAG02_NODE_55129_length_292_cov_0.803109_1_plen_24_part_10
MSVLVHHHAIIMLCRHLSCCLLGR